MIDLTALPSVALDGILPCPVPWVYFHGAIQDELQFDLVSASCPARDLPLGESEVFLHGTDRTLKLFLFTNRLGERRGYIVDSNSEEDLADGRKLLVEKPTCI